MTPGRVEGPPLGSIPMRVGITGGTGDLGRAVVARLLDAGHQVVASYLSTPPPSDLLAAQWRVLDITDASAVTAFARGLDAVVHTAYRSGAGPLQPVIVHGSANVAAAAAQHTARLIHVSTDMVFGGTAPEGVATAGPFTEADPVAPMTSYGAAKVEAERIVQRYCPEAVLLRPSLLWSSAHDDHQSAMVRDALSGARAVGFFTDEYRCPVRVQDVADAIELLLSAGLNGPLHVGGADRVSRHEFARLLAHSMGLDPDVVHGAAQDPDGPPRPKDVVLDSSLAVRELGVALPGVRAVLGS